MSESLLWVVQEHYLLSYNWAVKVLCERRENEEPTTKKKVCRKGSLQHFKTKSLSSVGSLTSQSSLLLVSQRWITSLPSPTHTKKQLLMLELNRSDSNPVPPADLLGDQTVFFQMHFHPYKTTACPCLSCPHPHFPHHHHLPLHHHCHLLPNKNSSLNNRSTWSVATFSAFMELMALALTIMDFFSSLLFNYRCTLNGQIKWFKF